MTQTAAGSTARLILSTTARTKGLAAGLAQGIEEAKASSQPMIDGELVNCNHPTFVYGHLSLYPGKLLEVMGLEAGDAAVPESYEALFSHGVACKHDPEGAVYPPFGEVLAHFNRAHEAAEARLAGIDDETLANAIEGNPRYAEVFGTCEAMTNFMLHDHYMFHLGQVSTWRRCFGLGSVMG